MLRTVTLTQTRDTSLGLSAVAVSFYDGQGILVNKKLGVKSAKELNGATVCVQPGTTTELNLADWFRANKIEFKPVVIDKVTEVVRAFESGRCDAFTDDASQLAAVPRRSPSRTTTRSCRNASRRNRWAPWCARATRTGWASFAGRCSRCWKPRNTASRRRTWMKCSRATIPTSRASWA